MNDDERLKQILKVCRDVNVAIGICIKIKHQIHAQTLERTRVEWLLSSAEESSMMIVDMCTGIPSTYMYLFDTDFHPYQILPATETCAERVVFGSHYCIQFKANDDDAKDRAATALKQHQQQISDLQRKIQTTKQALQQSQMDLEQKKQQDTTELSEIGAIVMEQTVLEKHIKQFNLQLEQLNKTPLPPPSSHFTPYRIHPTITLEWGMNIIEGKCYMLLKQSIVQSTRTLNCTAIPGR